MLHYILRYSRILLKQKTRKSLRFLSNLFVLNLCLTGCNYVNDEAPETKVLGYEDINNNGESCSFDPKSVEKVFEENITKDISCINNSLQLYAQAAKKKNPKYIDKEEMAEFLISYFEDGHDMSDGIDTLFEVNHHIYGDPENQISITNIDKLFEFLKFFNVNAIRIIPHFQESETLTEEEFFENRTEIIEATEAIATEILSIFEQTGQRARENIDLYDFFEKIRSESTEELVDQIHATMFLKPLITGGHPSLLSFTESKELLQKGHVIVGVVYEVVKSLNITFGRPGTIFEILLNSLHAVRDIFHHVPGGNEEYFDVQDLIEASAFYEDLVFDLSKYRRSAHQLKTSGFLGEGNDYIFRYNNMIKLFEHGQYLLEQTVYGYNFWEMNNFELISTDDIDYDLNPVGPFFANDFKYHERYNRISQDYRYYQLNNKLPMFDFKYHRDMHSFVTIASFEYIFEEAFKIYGHETSHIDERTGRQDPNGWALYSEELEYLIRVYVDFIVENGLWRNPPSLMSQNSYLMTDFFRYQADGNTEISVREATEYLVMQLGAFSLSEDLFPMVQEKCSDFLNELGEIVNPDCHREHFFDVLSELGGQYFPNLYSIVGEMGEKERFDFTKQIGVFARQCPFDSVVVRKKDLMLMLGGLMSIEEVMTLIDSSDDDLLDYDEIIAAYPVFREAIIEYGGVNFDDPLVGSIANLNDEALLKSALLYLVDKGTKPKIVDLIWFHLFAKKKKIIGTRSSIANILAFLGRPNGIDIPLDEISDDCWVAEPEPPNYAPDVLDYMP